MRLFERLFRKNEIRSEVISADDQIMRALSGVEVSPDTAMEIPAVSACVDFISQVIASLPVKLFCENREKNITEEIKDDPRLRLLNDETGDLLDPVQMKQAVIKDYFLRGGGFIYPEMDNNRVVSLRYIGRKFISIYNKSYDPVFKVGEYILTNGMTLRDDQLIKVLRETDDGLTGYSIIDQHQQLLSGMYRSLLYEKMLVTTGGNKKGFLVSDVKLDEKSMDALRKAWNEMYANTGNTMMILNKGLTFHESSNTSVEMQLSENKVRNNELACQIFGMSADAVSGKLSDEGLVAIIKSAVIPVITVFEAALNKGLLLPSERDLKYFSFDTTEMLRGDILKRYQAYKMGLESNVLQIDEVRYKEDLPPLGLNWIKLGLQDVLYDPKTKTIYTPNMNQYMQMGENKLPETVDSGAEGGIIEGRNNYIQNPDTGLMEGSRPSGGGSGGSSGGGSSGGSEGSGESGGGTQSDSSGDFHPVTDAAIEAVPKIAEFGSDEVNQAVHTACKDILTAVKDDPPGTEATVSISLDLTRKSAVQKGEPGAGTVKPVVLDVPYISIHNHASGDTFSDRDIRKFVADKNATAICVVGNNGKVYILQKTDSFNWIQFGIKTVDADKSPDYAAKVLEGAEQYGLQYQKK